MFFGVQNEAQMMKNRGPGAEQQKSKKQGSEVKNERSHRGPILIPSVAPEGTPPAMLLKKLAVGTSECRANLGSVA